MVNAHGLKAKGTPHNPWLTRYAWLVVAATLVLIFIGGLVTSKGAGMAVPDWPNTYGYNLFLFPVSQWVGGILYEHTHRLMGALVGLLTAVLAAWLWARETRGVARGGGLVAMFLALALLGARSMPVYVTLAAAAVPAIVWGLVQFARNPATLRWLGVTALAAVILQGVLGGLRVAWMADEIGVVHGMLAQSFLVLTGVIAIRSGGWTKAGGIARRARQVRGPLLLATALIFVQLGLGATMRHRHAGLAVPDFPLAYGRVWPRTDPAAIQGYNQQRLEVVAANPIAKADVLLHMLHRVGALLVAGAVVVAWRRCWRELEPGEGMRRWAGVWLGLVLLQFTLGAVTVWTNKAADIATAHVAIGSLVFLIGGLLCMAALKRDREIPASALPARSKDLRTGPTAGCSLEPAS